MLCHIISCPVMPCHSMYNMSYGISDMPYVIYHIMSCYMPCYVIHVSCHVIFVISCDMISGNVMPYHMSYHMSYNII